MSGVPSPREPRARVVRGATVEPRAALPGAVVSAPPNRACTSGGSESGAATAAGRSVRSPRSPLARTRPAATASANGSRPVATRSQVTGRSRRRSAACRGCAAGRRRPARRRTAATRTSTERPGACAASSSASSPDGRWPAPGGAAARRSRSGSERDRSSQCTTRSTARVRAQSSAVIGPRGPADDRGVGDRRAPRRRSRSARAAASAIGCSPPIAARRCGDLVGGRRVARARTRATGVGGPVGRHAEVRGRGRPCCRPGARPACGPSSRAARSARRGRRSASQPVGEPTPGLRGDTLATSASSRRLTPKRSRQRARATRRAARAAGSGTGPRTSRSVSRTSTTPMRACGRPRARAHAR